MDDDFRARVRAAAGAAWWTLFVGAAILTIQWVGYLVVMSSRPSLVLWLWGPGATWDTIRTTWFDALMVAKLTLWPLVLVAVWLTLWARRLPVR